MPYDAAHDAFAVSGLEERVAYSFPFRAGERELEMKFGGIADRIDMLGDGALRVVDYKPGRRIWSSTAWRAFSPEPANSGCPISCRRCSIR